MRYGLMLPLGSLLGSLDAILVSSSRSLTHLISCHPDGAPLPRALSGASLSIRFDQLKLLAGRAYNAHVHVLVNAGTL